MISLIDGEHRTCAGTRRTETYDGVLDALSNADGTDSADTDVQHLCINQAAY
jgi:hypothetical protein